MKKINNKVLLIGLSVLVGIFVVSRIFRSPKLEGNIRKELVSLDTADIDEIRITTMAADKPRLIKLIRQEKGWQAVQEDKTYPADASAVASLLPTIADLNAIRMISRKKDKCETYNVGEKGANVSVYKNGSLEAEFRVGKTGFNQSQGGQQQFGRQGIEAFTYVRMADEEEVYIVNGFLEATFNRSINDWRDKSFLRFDPASVTRVSFRYPADSSFVIEKKDSVWRIANRKADNGKVEAYLREFSSRSETSFADGFDTSAQPTYTVQFGDAGGTVATVDAWRQDEAWYLRSSRQPEVVFLNNDARTMNRFFAGSGNF
jgi:hypothetical protein